MCYVLAKQQDERGCVAFRTEPGEGVVKLKRSLMEHSLKNHIELVTTSRPSAYGEYEPYRFVDSEEAFVEEVLAMG